MNESDKLLNSLLISIKKNSINSIKEVKDNTLQFLDKNKSDNLHSLIVNASNRGYSAFEWIDFLGVGGINFKFAISWAYKVVKEQGLDNIIEPYYNHISHRLGITIKRNLLENSEIMALSLELRDTKIEKK